MVDADPDRSPPQNSATFLLEQPSDLAICNGSTPLHACMPRRSFGEKGAAVASSGRAAPVRTS